VTWYRFTVGLKMVLVKLHSP